MKITKLNKNQITFENGKTVKCSKMQILEYNIRDGKELDQEEYEEFAYALLLNKAYGLLARAEQSEKELGDKLYRFFSEKEIIKKVVSHIKDRGYINDEDYAVTFINNRKYGKLRLKFELANRGIQEGVFEKAYLSSELNEREKIEYHLKKIRNREYEKKVAYLVRQGFSLDEIFDVIGRNSF